ncbi:hypothetical protein ACFRAQ_34530 [Nocardia sp. NPDC056611]|uniref:hypothetical protein n=1 Tax=Nocardia sp. NPDC056611 TaxID=3345877 RepID=UPI00366F4757
MSSSPELEVLNLVDMPTVVAVDLNEDYQGDVAAVLQKDRYTYGWIDEDNKFAFVVIGYGSCSGCDAWQSMYDDPKAKLEHCLGVLESARWFDNLAELQAWVASDDTTLQWYGHEDRWKLFQDKVAELKHGGDLPGWID